MILELIFGEYLVSMYQEMNLRSKTNAAYKCIQIYSYFTSIKTNVAPHPRVNHNLMFDYE